MQIPSRPYLRWNLARGEYTFRLALDEIHGREDLRVRGATWAVRNSDGNAILEGSATASLTTGRFGITPIASGVVAFGDTLSVGSYRFVIRVFFYRGDQVIEFNVEVE